MSDKVQSSLKVAMKGSLLIFTGSVASIVLWFLSKLLLIRNTTTEELGIYSIITAFTGILSVFATLGFQEGVPRFISMLLGKGQGEEAKAIARTGIWAGICSGCIFFIAIVALAGFLADSVFYKKELRNYFVVSSFAIPCAVAANIISGVMRGYGIIMPKAILMDVGQPLFFLLLAGIVIAFQLPFMGIIGAYVTAIVIVAVCLAITYRRHSIAKEAQQIGSAGGNTMAPLKKLVVFSVPLLITSMLGIMLAWTDTLMLGRYTPASEVGLYNVSISLAKLLLFPLAALEFVYLPLAAELYSQGHHQELRKTYQVLTKWNFTATLPIFFVLFFFPEMTITVLFGTHVLDAVLPLRILSLCFLFHAFLGANGTLLLVMGRTQVLLKISVFGAMLNLILNYFLIKHFFLGSTGASVATLISYISLNVIASVVLFRISGIHPFTPSYVKPLAGAAVVAAVLYAVAKTLPLSFWMLPGYLALFLAGYVFSLLFTGSVEQEDILLLRTISEKTGLKLTIPRK